MSTLSDTTRLIMDVFLQYGIEKHHHLSLFNLFYAKTQWEKCHQDNFTKAVHELVNRGFMEWGEAYALVLTEEGYHALSHPNEVEKNREGALEGYELR
ncbi:MAG TPA: hypothetical protein VEI96_04345 [Thermodesulfovibrionales bacterium]|nr:hypothetical protein [Thermodesulfovibrionales bacterium]